MFFSLYAVRNDEKILVNTKAEIEDLMDDFRKTNIYYNYDFCYIERFVNCEFAGIETILNAEDYFESNISETYMTAPTLTLHRKPSNIAS